MFRLLLAIVSTVMAVTFVVANTHRVQLSLIFGPPVEVRLIFLLMSIFLLGIVVGAFLRMLRALSLRRHVSQHLRSKKKKKKKRKNAEEVPADLDLIAE